MILARGEAVPALGSVGILPAVENKGKPVLSVVEGMPSPRAASIGSASFFCPIMFSSKFWSNETKFTNNSYFIYFD